MFNSLFNRQLIMILTVVILASIGITYSIISIGEDFLEERIIDELEFQAKLLDFYLKDSTKNLSVREIVELLDSKSNTRYTIFDSELNIVYDNRSVDFNEIDITKSPELQMAIDNGYGRDIRHCQIYKEELMFIAIPHFVTIVDTVDTNTNVTSRSQSLKYIIRTSYPIENINVINNQFSKKIAISFGLVMLSIILILFISNYNIKKQFSLISTTTQKIAQGDFSKKLEIVKYDELKELELSINQMASKVNEKFNELQTGINNLHYILDSLSEGVVVVDPECSIVMINKLAETMLNLDFDKVKGENILKFRLREELRELIQQKRKKEIFFSDIDNDFYAILTLNENPAYKILAIKNISDHAQLKKTKTDFVSNVSHELRTPLTLIKGYSETLLLEELSDTHEKYVKIIQRHTERMIAIVKDLLLLSDVEHTENFGIKLVELDIMSIIDEMIHLYSFKSQDKGIRLAFPGKSTKHKVYGDRNLLETVLSNLIDNAIKYNRDGGEVTINLDCNDDFTFLSVSDNGFGIPKEDINQIFERFYTVDKARSREVGGTGLGLSIVKHVMNLHKGDITVESTVGSGTTFTLCLPANIDFDE